jgi:diguanylate cyclase (GGDEF)-like protein
MALRVALLVVLFCMGTAQARAVPARPVLEIPGATLAIDPRGNLSVEQARRQLRFEQPSRFVYPGVASAFYPLVVWVRIPATVLTHRSPAYLETAPGVGRAQLFYEPATTEAYTATPEFGTRIPYVERTVDRVRPTLLVPPSISNTPAYLRLSLDDESRLVPMSSLIDQAALRAQDVATERLAATALFFIGIFVSLAAANLFVFAFVRETPYVVYTGMMLSNALFASTYLHESAWKWLWPGLSLPDAATQGTVIILEALFLFAFARSFLNTGRLIPRADRVLGICAIAVMAVGVLTAYAFPSTRFGAVTGRDVFLIGCIVFVALVFLLGLIALRAGSIPARFFVISNAVVSLSAAMIAISSFSRHEVTQDTNFIALMAGQSVEGWLLFGALAFRLRQTVRAFIDEQGQRLVAQAEALARARALLESRQLAITDSLTGIANRRAFDETLAREWERAARDQVALSLLLIDIDHFKLFNDTYGHVRGDDCLRRVAGTIAACATRPTDLCARYGGEEFAVILAQTDEAGARAIADEILRAVRNLQIAHRDSSLGHVSISLGTATVVPVPGGPCTIAEAADANLYRAKSGGRNRFASAEYIDAKAARAERVEGAPTWQPSSSIAKT